MNYLSIEVFFILSFLLIGFIVLNKTNKLSLIDYKKKPIFILFILVLLIGLTVRFLFIESYPKYINPDEINIGYDAWSLANYGVDRYGYKLPVILVGRGSGQNALYAYLLIPLIKVFGLSIFTVRLLNAIFGGITLIMTLFFINKLDIKDNKIKLIILFMTSIFPWHIIKSRWGLEASIFPDLFLYGMMFIYLSVHNKKNRYYYISSILFSLSIYAYGTSYLIVPLFLLITYGYLLIRKHITIKHLLLNLLTIGLLTSPIIAYIIINRYKLDSIVAFDLFTIPRLYKNRMEMVANVGQSPFTYIWLHIKTGFSLLINQADSEIINNNLPNYGLYYKYSLPLVVIGLIYSFKNKNTFIKMNIFLLIISTILITYVRPNLSRINIWMIPIVILLINGIITIYKKDKHICYILIGLYIIQFILMSNFYMKSYQTNSSYKENRELLEALEYTKKYRYENLYITPSVTEGVYAYLFVYQIDPNEYNKYVVIINRADEYGIIRYKNIYSKTPKEYVKGNIYIVTYEEFKNNNYQGYSTAKYYANYIVIQ